MAMLVNREVVKAYSMQSNWIFHDNIETLLFCFLMNKKANGCVITYNVKA